MELGKYNELEVARETSIGLYLEDSEGSDVLLPKKWVPQDTQIGDSLTVFLYKDAEERLIATTLKPLVTLGTFAYLRVKQVSSVGAFLDWGLEKDLLVPFIEQDKRMVEGNKYLVYLYKDEMTDRLTASSKIYAYLEKEKINLKSGEEVDIIVAKQTDLGYNVIINHTYSGLLYENEVYKRLRIGEQHKAYIKQVREDHKIDVSLEKLGYHKVEDHLHTILSVLRKNNGFLNLHDKSDSAEISNRLGMSKKTFKKAIGSLYKQQIIRIEKDGIYLL